MPKALVPDAHDKAKTHAPIMFTTDLALKLDPEYAEDPPSVSRENPEQFAEAFGKAWYKLTHIVTWGQSHACSGQMFPPAQAWQDPVPEVNSSLD